MARLAADRPGFAPLKGIPLTREAHPEAAWGVGYFEGIRRVTRKLNIQPNLKEPKTKKEKPDFKILSFKELGDCDEVPIGRRR